MNYSEDGLAEELPQQKFACGLDETWLGVTIHDMGFLNVLLRAHPDWSTVLELGTSNGVTALLLGLAMRCRSGELVTFDRADYRPYAVRLGWLDNMRHHVCDLLSGPPYEGVAAEIARSAACLLLCDNGNKPEEIIRYAPLLRPGDGLVVHDWRPVYRAGVEMSPEQVPAFITEHPETWVPEQWDVASLIGTGFRAWVRR